ncbi:MAG: transposase domain-containing protein [Corynebacterium sp.]|uniref:transposase domain-containing protein n=1 Tax=Corynebacterium sp. TaxID=1720 RepID=UPI003F024209
MPRAGETKPQSPTRLSDLISVGVLIWVFPPKLVDENIAATDKTQQRHGPLPPQVTAYFGEAIALHQDLPYADVLDKLTNGSCWAPASNRPTILRVRRRSCRPAAVWGQRRCDCCLNAPPPQSPHKTPQGSSSQVVG